MLTIAGNLVDRYPLRALDAVQLACAVYASSLLKEAITFVSADKNLLSAASSEGFGIDNPITYP